MYQSPTECDVTSPDHFFSVKKSTPSEEDNHQPMEEVENDKNDNTEKAIGKMRRNGVIDSDEDDD